ncbi:MAG: neutral/alkaline non-lysosomal ceramidase N-terminal domain-containing protein, partial [Planctomycetales bacterium]|nr:neutral/alkaline non-lysosomal ceramidase N-terminal domain-containing protein [Planctomycetales bacterium]
MQLPTFQSRCRFGIAIADITPPVGIYHRMWGAATHDRSEGIHRPLFATAMYFGSFETDDYQVLVAVDHCLLGVSEVEMVLDRVATKSGLNKNAITITFSHTHAAGLLNLDRQELPGGELIPGYLNQLAATIAQLVVDAANSTTTADIVYGIGSCKLAAHRDFYDEDNEEFVCGLNPEDPADDTVMVARVTDFGGKTLAAIVNYACHPTTLAWDNRLISPDYPGAMRETIHDAIGAPCVFLQGASGDLGPVEGFVGDTEVADRNGRQLAFAALSVWESLTPANTAYEYAGKVVSGAAIGTWKRTAMDRDQLSQLATWSCDRQPVDLDYRSDL